MFNIQRILWAANTLFGNPHCVAARAPLEGDLLLHVSVLHHMNYILFMQRVHAFGNHNGADTDARDMTGNDQTNTADIH